MSTVPLSYIQLKTDINPAFVSSPSSQKGAWAFLKRRVKTLILFSCIVFILMAFSKQITSFLIPPPIVHLKQLHPDFVGRKDILNTLYDICIKKPKMTIPIIVLFGEGGVGKSEIASTFANQQINKFSLVCWIDSSTEESYNASYQTLGELLQIPSLPHESPTEMIRRIHLHLEREPTCQPWLLIFDNAEKALELPEQGRGVILITTRNYLPWHLFPCLEVGLFSEEEACELLKKITREKESPYRRLLIKELDYYPLVLNLSAHYIAETPGMTEEEYFTLLSQNKINLIDAIPIDSRYPNHLLASWEMAADQLFEKYPETLSWLHFCSFLCPNNIPKSWIEKWLNQSLQNENTFSRKMKVDEISRVMVNQSLAYYDKSTDSFSLHRLKQEIFKQDKHFEPKIQTEVLEFLINFIKNSNSLDELEYNPHLWVTLDQWEAHAIWFLNHYNQSLPNERAAQLQNSLEKWKSIKKIRRAS